MTRRTSTRIWNLELTSTLVWLWLVLMALESQPYCSELHPTSGMIRKNSHLRIARYHQHLHELLDLDISPLDYMLKSFPEIKEREEMRKIIGRYGLTGRQQVV
jgi:hypothetical protein